MHHHKKSKAMQIKICPTANKKAVYHIYNDYWYATAIKLNCPFSLTKPQVLKIDKTLQDIKASAITKTANQAVTFYVIKETEAKIAQGKAIIK